MARRSPRRRRHHASPWMSGSPSLGMQSCGVEADPLVAAVAERLVLRGTAAAQGRARLLLDQAATDSHHAHLATHKQRPVAPTSYLRPTGPALLAPPAPSLAP